MQGQRSTLGSLPEALNFDHGSTSSHADTDQQVCWNSIQNSVHNRLPDYVMTPNNTSITYLNATNREGQNLSGWNLGEPSSRVTQNQAIFNERKIEHGLSSSMSSFAGPGPIMEERQYEPTDMLSLNNVNLNLSGHQIANGPLFVQNSSSDAIPQDLNINAAFVEPDVDDCQIMECPSLEKSVGSENARISSASSSSYPFGVPPGTAGYSVEESDGRPGCSSEGRRLSCKRKALEGNVGQSSISGSPSYFQCTENSSLHAVPARYNAFSSSSISTPAEHDLRVRPLEQVNPRLGLGVGGATSETPFALNVAGSAESSRRNFRMRINPSHQHDPVPNDVFSSGNAIGQTNFMSSQHSSRFLPLNNSLDLRSAPLTDNTSLQRQSAVVHVPPSRRNLQSSRWSGGSSSRPGNSSGSEVEAAPHEEPNSTSMPRNISEHPMFVPATPANWSLTGGNISIARNVASSSRIGPSSVVHPSSTPNWIPRRNPQYPRRLSEFVRRSLLSSADSESGGQSSNSSPIRSGHSASAHEMAFSSGAGSQGHHPSHPRSAMLLDRQLDGTFGIPYSLRTLAVAGEGRSRLVSEIRNVLDLVRRGEGLRFEDVMILDQSVFVGMADIHDRHRDMRLDVDNMSYEELLALEERIGYVSTGLGEEIIQNRLKQKKHSSIAIGAQQDVEPCCVCQEEYNNGDDLGTLECGHDFHSGCIKQWLMQKNLCPICKTTALVP
ncbi:probable E3 ubiquitin-protein ligase RHG1A [Cornus florida]|uniref:probable E3 ubiquitin-protein ligase RHG1A n=1 Tax=Cornus florida TaxID=4283 RepID=UPI00289CE5C7|nr:probable E3 ubiquitin-protein ligase RHG1A [Cornus florida]XP_059638239.1 probable E3 ubiquitin-protein ligase RHG1A [Cornus florida]